MSAHRPTTMDTITALRVVGRTLGQTCAYQRDGRFYFPLDSGWCLAISPDDAGRFRVEACHGTRVLATLWVLRSNWRRLAVLAQALERETSQVRG